VLHHATGAVSDRLPGAGAEVDAFLELQSQLADQGVEQYVLAFEPALALWGAGRLERSRSVSLV
jgi:hypothetical protein